MTNDVEAVLRKIEYWHQGSIAGFKIICRDERGVWEGIRWEGRVSFPGVTDEKKAMEKLQSAARETR